MYLLACGWWPTIFSSACACSHSVAPIPMQLNPGKSRGHNKRPAVSLFKTRAAGGYKRDTSADICGLELCGHL